MTQQRTSVDEIRNAFQRGSITVPGPEGYHLSLFAACPDDGHESMLYRTDRAGGAITRAVFRCPACGRQFEASPERISAK